MDSFSTRTVMADEFDATNQLVYSAIDETIFRSSNNSSFLDSLSHSLDPEADHIILIPFNQKTRTVGTRKETIAGFFQDCNIFKVATNHLFEPQEPQGLSTISTEFIRCCWYHIPVERFHTTFEHATIHVWQVLHVTNSHIRVLVLYPHFLTTDIRAVLPSFFNGTSDYHGLKWAQIHLILIQVAISTCKQARWAIMSLGSMHLRGLVVALNNALDASPIVDCNESLSRLNLSINQISQLKALMGALYQYFERELPILDALAMHPAVQYINNFHNDIDFLMNSYIFLKEQLLLSRHTLETSIEIKNASYIRANTIVLRRIAEQNHADAQQAKTQSELAYKNSQSMAKIASLTMIYLPASFLATVFGMPFLDLDDSRQFSNLSKIWIYLIATLILTAITFLISMTWEQFSVRRRSQSPVDPSEEQLFNNNAHTLEPRPQHEPSAEELLQEVIDLLRDNDSDAHIDDGAISGSEIAEHEDSEVSNTNEVES